MTTTPVKELYVSPNGDKWALARNGRDHEIGVVAAGVRRSYRSGCAKPDPSKPPGGMKTTERRRAKARGGKYRSKRGNLLSSWRRAPNAPLQVAAGTNG
jgi:hypothetical protein